MKKSYYQRKKEEKKKKELKDVEKALNLKGLSTAERNKRLLRGEGLLIKEEKEVERGEGSPMRTEFKCSCGRAVIIESDVLKLHNISSCSFCR